MMLASIALSACFANVATCWCSGWRYIHYYITSTSDHCKGCADLLVLNVVHIGVSFPGLSCCVREQQLLAMFACATLYCDRT
jgi:hypothetical protein